MTKKNKNLPPQTNSSGLTSRQNNTLLALLTLIIAITYLSALKGSFVSDDILVLTNRTHELGKVLTLFQEPISIARNGIYFVLYRLFGLNPFPYHLVNILFHIGYVWMIYRIVPFFSEKKYLPFIVSLIAAVHPIAVESVTWISGGIYSQSGFFLLASFYWYLRRRVSHANRHLFFSWVLFICALSSSEKVIVFPFILLCYEFTLGNLRKFWAPIILFGVTSVGWFFLLLQSLTERLISIQGTANLTEITYILPHVQIPIALMTYLSLLFWPDRLTLYHTEFRYDQFNVSLYIMGAIAFFAFIAWMFKQYKQIFFWLCFFVISLLVTLTPLGISWLIAERYVYIGALGIYMSFGIVFYSLIEHKKIRNVGIAIFIVCIMALMTRTILRNQDWQTEGTLYASTVKVSPLDPMSHNNQGDVFLRQKKVPEAITSFRRALQLNPRYAEAYHNLGNAYQEIGDWPNAREAYRRAIALKPSSWQSYQSLSIIHFRQNEFAEALPYMKKASEVNPENPQIYANLGLIYVNLKQKENALKEFETALRLDPENELALVGIKLVSQIKDDSQNE